MRLAALIIPELERRFSSQRLQVLSAPNPFAIFDPVWADFGRLELHDDDDEVTAYFGSFTHSHFSGHAREAEIGKDAAICAEVIEVLQGTFSDEIEFYGNARGGGFREHRSREGYGWFIQGLVRRRPVRRGLWSRPLPDA